MSAIRHALELEYTEAKEQVVLHRNIAKSAIRAYLVRRFDFIKDVKIEETSCIITLNDDTDHSGLQIRISDQNAFDAETPFKAELRYSLVMNNHSDHVLRYLMLIGHIAKEFLEKSDFHVLFHENMQHVKNRHWIADHSGTAIYNYNQEIEREKINNLKSLFLSNVQVGNTYVKIEVGSRFTRLNIVKITKITDKNITYKIFVPAWNHKVVNRTTDDAIDAKRYSKEDASTKLYDFDLVTNEQLAKLELENAILNLYEIDVFETYLFRGRTIPKILEDAGIVSKPYSDEIIECMRLSRQLAYNRKKQS